MEDSRWVPPAYVMQKGGLITCTHIHTVYVSAINRQTDSNTCIKSKKIHVDRTDRQTDRHRQTDRQKDKNRDRQTRYAGQTDR